MYGSPELKQKTIEHYGGLIVSESMLEDSQRMLWRVEKAVADMPPMVKAMGGKELGGILDDMASVISEQAHAIDRLQKHLETLKNGK